MSLPHISIVIVAYNEERNIADCLDSLQRLEYPADRHEIIVVDSSSDRTPDIVRSYPNVRLVLSDRRDFSIVRNRGLREARHDLIAYIDADCIAPADWLLQLVPKIDLPDVAAVGCNAYPPLDTPFLGKCFACLGKPAGGAIGFDSEVVFLERGVNFIGSGCSLYRKADVIAAGGFNENLPYGNEDVDLCERLIQAGRVLEYVPDAFVYHKTRNTFRQFIPWAFRRGKAHFFATRPRLAKILLDPFSVLWLAALLAVLFLSPQEFLPYYALVALLGFLGVAFMLFGGGLSRFFPTGSKKFRLLVERRGRIGVNAGIILFCVLPLFYLDRFTINLAQAWYKIASLRRS